MALPTSFYGQTLADNTIKGNGEPETASWQVPITALTAANLVAQQALLATLATATAALLIGVVNKEETVQNRQLVTAGPAASILAQRENKFLVRYHSVTLMKKFRVSLPTADLSILPDHSEFVDISTGDGAAYKSAFEAVVKSPDDGAESVVLDSIQFVGRNT